MELVLATAALMGLIMLVMAIGVMVSGRRLRGSCGGVSGGEASCPCDEAKRQACARKHQRRSAPPSTAPPDRSLAVWRE